MNPPMDLPPKHVDMDQPMGEGEEDDDEKYPILFLDVNLGKGKVDRLIIMDGDDPMTVADEFCDQHSKWFNFRFE